ncbi:adenosylcobinamide-phosphate synthase CbiB [Maritimibacter sp. DP1N21-5]|uniref:adenosylcobinamide-phosphate synthase CbiB n=1 Tax=Maritimibacter sp. DP1N21-5 TaxID=2836867 RepID=UPI001C45CF72|nr:adenosylcobinamide-phosphate synthase CbiB [Maritimibacter sp. DP1N21-5]MBV7408308.1 adenosylcobinamide-phosphate synthase CbiB [Maritimibacter sp. DP1N21-5]
MSLVLACAMALDAAFGEPEKVWGRVHHPAVLMGKAVGWADATLNHGKGRIVTGAVAIIGLVTVAAGIGWGIAQIGWLAEILAAAILLAHRSLVDHVMAVANALADGLAEGRRAVGKIVGRDTGGMDASDVSRAAIESAAENFSDGVVAPAFWFLVGGLPGMLAYKMVNTADSMIGYRTPRHEAFGKAAARLDDVMNWIPARLTAGLMLLVTGHVSAGDNVRRDAALHRSPNAGWPEAAMAVALDVSLSGPRSYHGERRDFPWVNPEGERVVGGDEIDGAVGVLWRVWAAVLGLVIVLGIVW